MPTAVSVALPKRHPSWGGAKLRALEHFGASAAWRRHRHGGGYGFGVGQTSGVPQAEDYPRGALVLSTDGTDRSNLRWSALGLGLLLMGVGFGAGWIAKGRRRG